MRKERKKKQILRKKRNEEEKRTHCTCNFNKVNLNQIDPNTFCSRTLFSISKEREKEREREKTSREIFFFLLGNKLFKRERVTDSKKVLAFFMVNVAIYIKINIFFPSTQCHSPSKNAILLS